LSKEMAYQLPTEAQWEYACRAGTVTAYSLGDSIHSSQASFGRKYSKATTPVGTFPPNPWGFHDMHGNVWEWCADWYGAYPRGAERDPVGPAVGSDRIARGGSWNLKALEVRSAFRNRLAPNVKDNPLGFRLSLRAVRK